MVPSAEPSGDGRRVLVYNPDAGSGDHGDRVRSLAADHGFEVRETDSAEDVVDTAAVAAGEADVVAAGGGDGTLTRVVRGIDRADAFGNVCFAAVPLGTGNNFAGNVGVADVEAAFALVEDGERRRIDVGTVDGMPFLNSVVAGLTAESSAATGSGEKERWGVLAYAMQTARTAREFDGLTLTVEPEGEDPREVTASVVLVGNGRRVPRGGRSQADMEDGRLDVTIFEDVGVLDLVEDSIHEALGDQPEGVEHFTTHRLNVDIDGDHDSVSVDGEILTAEHLSFGVRERVLELPVGESYDPHPGE
ncbi:diacylglycerol/lipid kinase family protein [Halomicrobium salinisoli]|uniref:diacylglycerol/lipid kinase family protein n=1 Tax=Halomicrobium salinisoli TaxID=2878391 RepID=UPI001CF02E53|nr:diacylglycerol kinase family protein [Halomicrobium salinisoli]